MTSRLSGLAAEKIAQSFLEQKGYKHLESNFRSRFGEIDLIMLDHRQIVFVEVKARKDSTHGTPAEFITSHKLSRILKTTQFFLIQNPKWKDYRVDAVEVYLQNPININHIKNITL